MDVLLKEQVEKLRALTSEDAASWLMERYPAESADYDQAIVLLAYRSWKKSDHLRLARHYLRKIPFASSKPYEVFASVMSLSNFVKVIHEQLPVQEGDLSLLLYHLEPVLKGKMKSGSDEEIVARVLSELRSSR